MSLNSCPPSFKIVKLGNPDAERDSINAALQAIVRCMASSSLPSQAGHAGQYLTTDGTNVSWAAIAAGQAGIQYKDEGTNLGTSGTVDEVDFTGAGVSASRAGNKITVNVAGSSGGQVDTIVAGDGIDVDSTDPVNPVVEAKISADANNAVSFGSDSGLYVPDNGFYLDGKFGVSDYDDFVRGVSAATPIRGGYTLSENVGASSSVNNNFYDAGCAGHQGVIQAVTGTATFGLARLFGAGLNNGITGGMLHLGDGQLEVIWWFRVDALSSGTLRYQIWAGLANRGDGTGPADAIYLIYSDNVNSGVVTLRSIVSSVTQTDAVGTTALAANTWYRARIVINAAMNQADLYLKPYGSAEVHECTYTGSMPVASIGLGLLGSIFKVSGTGSATCCWDRWQYNYRFTNER